LNIIGRLKLICGELKLPDNHPMASDSRLMASDKHLMASYRHLMASYIQLLSVYMHLMQTYNHPIASDIRLKPINIGLKSSDKCHKPSVIHLKPSAQEIQSVMVYSVLRLSRGFLILLSCFELTWV